MALKLSITHNKLIMFLLERSHTHSRMHPGFIQGAGSCERFLFVMVPSFHGWTIHNPKLDAGYQDLTVKDKPSPN